MSPHRRAIMDSAAGDGSSRTGADRTVEWLILSLMVVAPLCLGGMHPWAQVGLSVATIVIWTAHAIIRMLRRRRMVWPIGTLMLLATAAWVGLMALPVPVAWLPAFQAQVHGWWQHTGKVSFSLLPGAAPLAMLQWVALALATQMTATRFSHPDRLEPLLRSFTLGAGLTLVVGIAQMLTDATRILGVYSPTQVQGLLEPLAGTFVNPNQAGALYALAGSVGISLFAMSSRPIRRAAGLVGAIAAAAVLVATGSLGALAALLFAAISAVTGMALFRYAGALAGTRTQLGLTALGVAALGAWTTGFMAFPFETRLPETALQKLQLWRNAAQLIPESPWFGMGTGSFADLAERTSQGTLLNRFSLVESVPLQLAIDLGVPIALLLYLTLIVPAVWWIGTPAGPQQVRWRHMAIVVGICALVEQFLGMGLNALGVSLPGALLLGAILGIARRLRTGPSNWVSPTNLGAIAVTAALIVSCGLHLTASVRQTMESPADRTVRLLRTTAPSQAEALIQTAALRQPASPALLYVDALLALRQDRQSVARQRLDTLLGHAPHALLTRRLQLLVAVVEQNNDAICDAISQLIAIPGERVRWSSLPGGAAEWMHCLPNEAALTRLYGDMQAQGQPSLWLAAAMADLRRSPHRLVSLDAAARALLALEMPESSVFYADQLFEHAPRNGFWADVLMNLFGQLGTPEKVDPFVLDAFRISPQDPILTVMRLELLVRRPEAFDEETNEWGSTFTQARQLTARNEPLWLRLLRAESAWATQQSDWERAARSLDLYLGRRGSDASAIRERIHVAEQLGDEQSALRYQIRLQQLQAPAP
jgi:hypothetical protein